MKSQQLEQICSFHEFPSPIYISNLKMHSIIIQISMKFSIGLISVLLALTPSSNSMFAASQCGQGRVPSLQNGICIEVSDYIEGCQQYKNQVECGKCNQAYYSSQNGMCEFSGIQENVEHIPGCLQYEDNKSKNSAKRCINCANGYYRNNGNCEKGIKDCVKYDQNTKQCQECKDNFSLIMGECRHNYHLGCRSQNHDHSCEECFRPFKLDGNHCSIPNCKSFNDFGCTACGCGYYLTEERTCKEITEGCLRYNRGKCINCVPHFRIKGGICEIEGCQQYTGNVCERCQENYELSKETGGCIFKNCEDWNDGQCLTCKEGFRRNHQGVCEESQNVECGGASIAL